MEYLSKLTKIALPMFASSLMIIVTNLLNVRLLGQLNPQNFYLLALYLPLYYLLICFFESARICVIYFYAQKTINKFTPLVAVVSLTILLLLLLSLLYWLCFPLFSDFYHVTLSQRQPLFTFSLLMIIVSILTGISYLLASVLYAKTHSYSAFIVSFFTCLLNFSLTYNLSHNYHLGLLSLVLATLLSSALSCLTLLLLLLKKKLLQLASLSWSLLLVFWKQCFQLAFPVFVSFLITFVGFSSLTQIVSHFGEMAVAGFGLALRVQGIIILPAISLAIATAVLYRQSHHTNTQGIKQSLLCVFLLYGGMAVTLFLLRGLISSFLTNNPTVQHYCSKYFYWVALSYSGFGAMLFCLTLFEQIGLGRQALLINAIWFSTEIGLGGVWAFYSQTLDLLFIVIAVMNFISIPTVLCLLLRERAYGFIKLSTT